MPGRQAQGRYDRERNSPVLQKALDGRFVLVDAPSGSPNLLIKDVGSGLNGSQNIGSRVPEAFRVEDQPDYAYGKWVAQLIQQALAAVDPCSRTSTPW